MSGRFNSTCDFGHPTAEVARGKGGNGAHVKFPNGWVVSVQWGPGTYSTNHHYAGLDYPYPEMEALTAEIAAWKGDGEMIRWPDGDSVQGWTSWDEVQAVLDHAESDRLDGDSDRGFARGWLLTRLTLLLVTGLAGAVILLAAVSA